ncbi:hypothetical protein ABTD92_22415, partial [Acinetobacter baumannii]
MNDWSAGETARSQSMQAAVAVLGDKFVPGTVNDTVSAYAKSLQGDNSPESGRNKALQALNL